MADLVVSDNTPITIHCKTAADGSAKDLTGFTATLKFEINGATPVTKSMTIASPATDGKVTYRFATGDIATNGKMRAEVMVTDASSNQETQNTEFYWTCRKRIV